MATTTHKPLRFLILGTGGMAQVHTKALQAIAGVEVIAGVDTDTARVANFCDTHNIGKAFTSLDEALAWGEFDAACNVTPDWVHYPSTLALLRAGKPVLCEKPLATAYTHAAEMANLAKQQGVINMVNLSYRGVAALQKAQQLVAAGTIGTLRHVEASYLQSWLTQPAWGEWREQSQWLWRLSTAHGSKGVLGDVGVHILDFLVYAAGSPASEVSCRLKTFDKAPGNQIGEYPLDANDSAVMHLQLTNGAIGVVHATRFATGHLNDLHLRLWGDLGGIEVSATPAGNQCRICHGENRLTAQWETVECPPVEDVYTRFVAALRGEATPDPDFAHGAALQQVLDLAIESDRQQSISLPIGSAI